MTATTVEGIRANLTNTAYHEQADWLSSSQLKALLPERYKQGGSQDALDFGSAFHAVVLENGEGCEVASGLTSWRSKGAAEERARITAAGHIPILESDVPRLHAMAEKIEQHPIANELLHVRQGVVEESAFATVDDVPCKARFDKRIPGAIVDLKSTAAKPGARSLGYAIRDYGYDLSAAHYLAVASELDLDVSAFVLVFVGKEAPHYVTVVDLSEQTIARGLNLREEAIQRHLKRADAYEGATGFLTI